MGAAEDATAGALRAVDVLRALAAGEEARAQSLVFGTTSHSELAWFAISFVGLLRSTVLEWAGGDTGRVASALRAAADEVEAEAPSVGVAVAVEEIWNREGWGGNG